MGAITQFGAYTRQELEAKCEKQAFKIANLLEALINLVDQVQEIAANQQWHGALTSDAIVTTQAAIAAIDKAKERD